MNAWRFILVSLRHYRRIHLAVALGVAVATAVLTGALLVGDSVRGSLRDLTLQRLGRIDSVIVSPHFFREKLAHEMIIWPADEGNSYSPETEPAILLNGTLQYGAGQNTRRANSVSVIGCAPQFSTLGEGGPSGPLADEGAAITESLANEMNVNAGDEILLTVPVAGAIPADSPLGAKALEKTSKKRRLTVLAVLPPKGLARFGLVPSQQLPRNLFVSLGTLQKLLEQPNKVNAIFVATADDRLASSGKRQGELRKALRPKLIDYGVRVEHLTSPIDCVQISADELVLPAE